MYERGSIRKWMKTWYCSSEMRGLTLTDDVELISLKKKTSWIKNSTLPFLHSTHPSLRSPLSKKQSLAPLIARAAVQLYARAAKHRHTFTPTPSSKFFKVVQKNKKELNFLCVGDEVMAPGPFFLDQDSNNEPALHIEGNGLSIAVVERVQIFY